MTKQAHAVMASLDIRVTMNDGAVHDYRTTPVDNWRAEKVCGRPIAEAVNSYGGWAALAYSCAVRSGHAYRQRRQSTNEVELFEAWLTEVADLAVLGDEDEPQASQEDPTGPDSSGSS